MGHFTRTPVGRENELSSHVGVGAFIHAGVEYAGASVGVDAGAHQMLVLMFIKETHPGSCS